MESKGKNLMEKLKLYVDSDNSQQQSANDDITNNDDNDIGSNETINDADITNNHKNYLNGIRMRPRGQVSTRGFWSEVSGKKAVKVKTLTPLYNWNNKKLTPDHVLIIANLNKLHIYNVEILSRFVVDREQLSMALGEGEYDKLIESGSKSEHDQIFLDVPADVVQMFLELMLLPTRAAERISSNCDLFKSNNYVRYEELIKLGQARGIDSLIAAVCSATVSVPKSFVLDFRFLYIVNKYELYVLHYRLDDVVKFIMNEHIVTQFVVSSPRGPKTIVALISRESHNLDKYMVVGYDDEYVGDIDHTDDLAENSDFLQEIVYEKPDNLGIEINIQKKVTGFVLTAPLLNAITTMHAVKSIADRL